MTENQARAIAIVGVGAVLPDAPDAPTYWENLTAGRYSISEVDADRWDRDLYYDADPAAPDKTYSIIGGWVRDSNFEPLKWRMPIPPKVSEAMDRTQKWSVSASRQTLMDYGYPDRPLDPDRTAVIFGNAMAGDMHYLTALRAYFPEYAEELKTSPSFAGLPEDVRAAIIDEFRTGMRRRLPDITEDTMPGELSNIIAGRVANLFNFHGPNFVTDAACASALAAIDAAVEGLQHGDYDSVLTGGIDANMGVPSFIKFCKIGALSATGTRPYHQGADGFVMGEGAAVMLLKRLADAERDGDHIYAVIRGLGGSSDGKGKGITAPNPIGQEFAIARAWRDAGIAPTRATYIEGHGTSTRVGDVVEVESLSRVFADLGLAPGSMPLGSVKSNIGHLKSAAGAAGMLKAAMALDTKILPPTLGTSEPNPNIDFARSPLYLNKELAEWKTEPGQVRSAGVSAFGFGGTNFHIVLEEYVPGRIQVDGGKRAYSFVSPEPAVAVTGDTLKAPLRGALVVGAATGAEVKERLSEVLAAAEQGEAPDPAPPRDDDLRADYRVAIDYGDAAELADKVQKAIRAIDGDNAGMWKALRNQGVFVGRGAPKMTAFLYTGQGSQYVNMLESLRSIEPIVADIFDEADRVMEPVLGRALTEYIFVDGSDKEAAARAERGLMQTEITQPAVLTVDDALTQLTAAYGIYPDMVMGHSLGEYGALVAAGAMPFEDALEAVAGRGKEMASVDVPDKGLMAAVFAPIEEVQRITDEAENYVVVANVNSSRQAVIGGSTAGVTEAGTKLAEAGYDVIPLPVSHAFHTEIVAPASESLKNLLTRLRIESPAIPLVANVDGEFYPMGPNVAPKIIDILGRQVAAPVQFVKGLRKLYDSGCRVFVEMGPKRALQGFADDVLGDDPEVVALFANHPKQGDIVSFNQALCGMYAAGLGVGTREGSVAPSRTAAPHVSQTSIESRPPAAAPPAAQAAVPPAAAPRSPAPRSAGTQSEDMYNELGHLFADFLAKGYEVYSGQQAVTPAQVPAASTASGPTPLFSEEPVVVTGAGLGLPGGRRVFGDDKVPALLHGEQFIDAIPLKHRQQITDKKITRLVKSEAGGGRFETIDNVADVIKLAGRGGEIDLVEEFGFPKERVDALDRSTLLAIGAGLDALRDAGIPLAMHYKTTTTGTKLPERWMLPEAYRDTTGVIFASAFPGADAQFAEIRAYEQARALEKRLEEYKSLQSRLDELGGSQQLAEELQHRIHEIEAELERNPYLFNRKFLYRALSMGHSQFAEYIGARGPNTQVNAACASTTQAVAIAEDWIRAGRCERVIVVAGDDVTSDNLLEWVGAGFLAVGAAATDEAVEDAALPFDRRRHGMILGMGAAAIVVEHPASVRQRGIAPIAQVLAGNSANSAFHGSRLDPSHIKHVVEDVVAQAERRWGINRHEIAPYTVFVSHETYTPARGGSAQAEIDAIRFVFGESADKIVIANTKGYTGHAMGVGVEDVLAIKAMETGLVPPVPNFKEPDPDLGVLNLSRGGSYPIQYALRLGAGFGSQIATTLYRHVPLASGVHPEPDQLGYESRLTDPARWKQWLQAVSGNPNATVEIERRTLRVRDDGAPVMAPQLAPAVQSHVASPSSQVSSPAPVVPAASVAPTAPVAPVAPVAPAAAVSEPVGDPVADRVLEIVSAQTGYPSDMLDLDLDMEADLGIDTVKQAETFAAIREEWGIARDDSLALRDYPTLGAVIGFVYEKTGLEVPSLTSQVPSSESGVVSSESVAPGAPAAADGGAFEVMRGDYDAAAAVPRRIPTAVLRPDLASCKPTGIELGEGSRVVVMLDEGGVGASLVKKLEKLGAATLVIDDRPATDELLARLDRFSEAGPISGVYWLPALDVEAGIADMDLAGWREALRIRVKLLYGAMRHLYDTVGATGTFLVSATRLGGRHGYDAAGAVAPLGGAVTGFTKAFKREKPDALVKAVDFPVSRKTASLADALIEETLTDPGAVEVGRADARRWSVSLVEESLAEVPHGIDLGPESVYVVTGAAGSITSAITADLARAGGGVFHLLDLTPEPDRDDPDIVAFGADKEGLKRTVFERLKASGERATPAMVDKQLAGIERLHAALTAIRAIEDAGGTVHYHCVNLLDGDAVEAAMARVAEISGRVDVLLHAGGLEISRLLPDKEPGEYDLVFDVKADGWFNLLHGLGDTPIASTVVFSSVAGRFGNNGQTDYSAANDLLCKFTSSFKTTHPERLGVAFDWTAWGDIGMATRGSIPTVMKALGVDMLPAAAGIPIVRRELTLRQETGEQVVALRLGGMAGETDDSGGFTGTTREAAVLTEASSFELYRGLVATATLDPTVQPFLFDHKIDGTALLPGVMGMETFAELAMLGYPDMHVVAVEDMQFLAPFKFYRDEPREIKVSAIFTMDGDDILAHCKLVGERVLANQPEPQVTEHFTGTVRLGAESPTLEPTKVPEQSEAAVGAADIYEIYFHGPAYQVLESAWADGERVAGLMASGLAPNHVPEDAPTATWPRGAELAFQTSGIWEIGTTAKMALPMQVGRVQFAGDASAAQGRLVAVVEPTDVGFSVRIADEAGTTYLEMTGYATSALPGSLPDDQVAPLRQAITGG